MTSISITIVDSSSHVTDVLNIIIFNHLFIDLINRSYIPPHQVDAGTINFQLIPITNNSSINRTSSLLKHVALSDIIRFGTPLLPMNLFKFHINEVDPKSGTRSNGSGGSTGVYHNIYVVQFCTTVLVIYRFHQKRSVIVHSFIGNREALTYLVIVSLLAI